MTANDAVRLQGERQQAILQRIQEILEADPRVQAAWLTGSFGRDTADEWSDLDLHVAVDDAAFMDFVDNLPSLYEKVARPILIQPHMPSDNLSLGGATYQLVYFQGAVMVDWNVGPASRASKPTGHKVLFEKQPFAVMELPPFSAAERLEQLQWWTIFFWAMLPLAVKHVARGETRRAASMTDLLARGLICIRRLLAEEPAVDPWVTWANRPLEPEIDRDLPRAGTGLSPAALLEVIEQQRSAMLALHDRLASLKVDLHPEMVVETARLIGVCRDVIAAADFRRRIYR